MSNWCSYHTTSWCLKGNLRCGEETGTEAAAVFPHLEHSSHQNTKMNAFAVLNYWCVFFSILKIFTLCQALENLVLKAPSSPTPLSITSHSNSHAVRGEQI